MTTTQDPASATVESQVADFQKNYQAIEAEVGRVIVGHKEVVAQTILCLMIGGHALLEGVPGLGKTLLVRTLAQVLDLQFSRIQFTPDLMPADIVGTSIVSTDDGGTRQWVFQPGPIFGNLILADEINRATPKTQSALLEVMERGKVSADGETHAAGLPFMVFATQNPIDYEGTFPLPESQMDRFLLRLQMGYPEAGDELEILRSAHAATAYDAIPLTAVVTRADVLHLQALVGQVFIEDSVLDYILRVITATRTEAEFRAGISVRGGLALKRAAQARALLSGRDFVVPDDVQALVPPVFVHRLTHARPSADPLEARHAVLATLKRILAAIPAPV